MVDTARRDARSARTVALLASTPLPRWACPVSTHATRADLGSRRSWWSTILPWLAIAIYESHICACAMVRTCAPEEPWIPLGLPRLLLQAVAGLILRHRKTPLNLRDTTLKLLTIIVVLNCMTSKRLQLLRFCAIRLQNCLQLLWFCAARLQNAYNYLGFARHDSFPCYFINFTYIFVRQLICCWFS